MMANIHSRSIGALVLYVSFLLLVATTFVGAEVDAQPMQSPVYSDASVAIPETNASAFIRGEAGFNGTGELIADTGASIAVPNAEELLALPPVTSGLGVETIIGLDTRVKVYTTDYPARAVALITFDGGRCTGWLYGSDVVATAGHCVHEGPGGNWRTGVTVYPGYNGADAANPAPFGSCGASWLGSVHGWVAHRDEQYDYGVVKLNCTIGNTTGWFGYWWQSASLLRLNTIIGGYPADKPLEQWWSSDQVRAATLRQVFYMNDTIGGNSGGPVWQDRDGPYAMAIHAYGLHGRSPHGTNNHGTRITKEVFNNLKAWKDSP